MLVIMKEKCFIIQHTESMMIMGCFKTKKDAKNYVNGNNELFIIKTNIISLCQ